MSDQFKHNLNVFRKRFPDTASVAETAENSVALEMSKSGKVSGKAGSIWLASRYDPVREAVSFAKGQKNISPGMEVALYGIGLGYHLRPLLDVVGPEGKVLAAEANGAILKAALKAIDDPDIFNDPRLTIVSGRDENEFLAAWSKALSALNRDKTGVVIHNPSFQSLPSGYGNVAKTIELVKMDRRFPRLMGEAEKICFKRNLQTALKSTGISSLTGILDGGVAAVVGAGPSLERSIAYLAACDKMTILASDTSLPALLNAGITPDFVVMADPQPYSLLHFIMADRFDLPLITLPTSNSDVLERWCGPLYFGFKNPGEYPQPACDWARDMGEIRSGGSVSCIALEMAIRMGAGAIMLFGQDFGYPDGRAYAAWTAPGILNQRINDESRMVKQTDYFGREILAPINLYAYKRDFESMIENVDIKVVTLSPEGQRLNGVDPVPSPAPWFESRPAKPDFPFFTGSADAVDPKVWQAFHDWLEGTSNNNRGLQCS